MKHPIPANSNETLRTLPRARESWAGRVTRLSLSETRELPAGSGRHHGPPNAASVFASIASQSTVRSSPRVSAMARTVTGTRYDALGRPR
jgi:hypothetical protein